MTVTLGQGANATIEDSPVLSTLLDRLVHDTRAKSHQIPTDQDIKALVAEFREAQYDRSHAIYKETRLAGQFQTRKGFIKRVMGAISCHTDQLHGSRTASKRGGSNWVRWGIVPLSLVLGVSLLAKYQDAARSW
jgi:2-polyprenyl-6-methoxyphenol hydroxylase-like FAD-dependent oxidoreductase